MKVACPLSVPMRNENEIAVLSVKRAQRDTTEFIGIITTCSSRLPVTAVASTAKHAILISALP